MPKMNGKAVLERIRTAKPEIPAIFVSGYPADILQESGIEWNETDILLKPVAPSYLLRKIRETLHRHA